MLPSSSAKNESIKLSVRRLSKPPIYHTDKEPGSHNFYIKDADWGLDSAKLLNGLLEDPDQKNSLSNPLALHYNRGEARRNRRILDEQEYLDRQRREKKKSAN